MKAQNRIKGRLPFPAHANQMLARIRIMTRELENIQSEIYGRVSEGLEPEKGGLLCDAASARVLAEFRSSLDQLRNLLWLCTQAAGEDANQAGAPERHRQLAQTAALLRAMAPGSRPSSSAAGSGQVASSMSHSGAQDPVSFFDRLDRVIDNYVEGGGTLLEPRTRQRPKT